MTENEINDLTADVKVCMCGALIEEVEGGGYSYWVHVKRVRIDYGHAAIPKLPMPDAQIGEYTQGMAERYRKAKADYLDPKEWAGTAEQREDARKAFSEAGQRLASSVLDDIDEAKVRL